MLGTNALFTECRFWNNTSGVKGGAVWAFQSTVDSERCLYVENTSGDVAGAFYLDVSSGAVLNNTFAGNSSPGALSGTVTVVSSPSNEVSRNIFHGDASGYGLRYVSTPIGPHECNVYWINADGAIGGSELADTEVVADPLFCDLEDGDFSVDETSPAAPLMNPCGVLAGAFPDGCPGGVPTVRASWGALKGVYAR